MSSLVVTGGRSVSGGPVTVSVEDGVVASSSSGPVLDATGLTVLPGLVDLQVNGAGGVDVTAEPSRLWEVGATLASYGVTAFLPTVITSTPSARDEALTTLAAGPPPGWSGALPLGLHLEGPMIAPGRHGAHPPSLLAAPSLELIGGWSRDAGVAMVTLAPELPGALDVIAALVARGVVVSVGHTAASAAEVLAAGAAGARCVTHVGNAMPPLAGRDPGPVGAALDSGLVAGVIADGHHLDPVTLAVYARALGPDRLLAVSDTTAALGLPDGPTRLGVQDVMVAGGTVRLADGTLAGSAASLLDCLRVLTDVVGLPAAVRAATVVPAAVLGDAARGHLVPGARGDLVLVDEELNAVVTVVGGRVVHDGRP